MSDLFLLEALGTKVFADGITISDDPHRPHGLRSRPFDGEGLATRRTTLVLLSDMVHAAGELNMARAANIPDDRWITERKQQSRLPDLTGICVIVAGADVSSTHGAKLRKCVR